MLRSLAKLRDCCRGAVAVEFALISPVLFALLFGTVEYGRYIWIEKTIQHGLEDAARYGSFRFRAIGAKANADIVAYATNHMTGVLDASVAVVFKKISGIDSIEISAQYSFLPIIPGISQAGKWTITTKAVQPI